MVKVAKEDQSLLSNTSFDTLEAALARMGREMDKKTKEWRCGPFRIVTSPEVPDGELWLYGGNGRIFKLINISEGGDASDAH